MLLKQSGPLYDNKMQLFVRNVTIHILALMITNFMKTLEYPILNPKSWFAVAISNKKRHFKPNTVPSGQAVDEVVYTNLRERSIPFFNLKSVHKKDQIVFGLIYSNQLESSWNP